MRIDVCDSGVGVPEDKQRSIFAEFYRFGRGSQDRGSGLGLGLAIVDRLAGLLNHPIEVTSHLGRGSRFSVAVPSAPVGAMPASDAPRSLGVSEPRKLVIVIDDDELTRDSTRGLLQQWGYLVVTAECENDAMAKLAELGKRPDLIISDYRLAHERTGFELIDRLRRACGAQIPAFLISGDTAPDRLREARDGGYYLLHKPVMPINLRSVVSQLLRDERGEPANRQPTMALEPVNRELTADPSPMLPPR